MNKIKDYFFTVTNKTTKLSVIEKMEKYKIKDAPSSLTDDLNEKKRLLNVIKIKNALKLLPVIIISIAVLAIAASIISTTQREDALFMALFFILLFGVGFICTRLCISISKKSEAATEYKERKQAVDDATASVLASLNVPNDAYVADIIVSEKFHKEGKEVSKMAITYQNLTRSVVYSDEEYLYFFIHSSLYALPLSRIKDHLINSRSVNFSGWNKDIPTNKEPYKYYNIGYSEGTYFVKYTSCLIVEDEGEKYKIVFMPYDTESINKLSKITAYVPEKERKK